MNDPIDCFKKIESEVANEIFNEKNGSFDLPKDLKLGVATASTQIEGGDSNSNWNNWFEKGMIKDGSNPSRANNHYELYKEDIDLMDGLNIKYYRMSLEWSRLEPQNGIFADKEFAHYRDEIKYLKSKNIEILLTLHHFNNPMWFEKLGGFKANGSHNIFLRFVNKVIKELGDLVNEYVTINEPNVYFTSAYYFGEFPPGEKSIASCRKVMTNLAKAHIEAYKSIHNIRKNMGFFDTKVGYASHVRVFEPLRKWNLLDVIGCKLMTQMFQKAIDTACLIGKVTFPVLKDKDIKKGKYYDFIGINYYSRSMVKVFKEMPYQNAAHNDMGWEIYSEGLRKVTEEYYEKFKAPIYITENGTADRLDNFRSKYIYDHLKVLSNISVPIERYYHWTFIDNFEWMDGEEQCFGLIENDYKTQKRTIRKSGHFYSEIIKNSGVTDEMVRRYLND